MQQVSIVQFEAGVPERAREAYDVPEGIVRQPLPQREQPGKRHARHLYAVAHHYAYGRILVIIEFRHYGVSHCVKLAVRHRPAVLRHSRGVGPVCRQV